MRSSPVQFFNKLVSRLITCSRIFVLDNERQSNYQRGLLHAVSSHLDTHPAEVAAERGVEYYRECRTYDGHANPVDHSERYGRRNLGANKPG